jgi:hypothetical protein
MRRHDDSCVKPWAYARYVHGFRRECSVGERFDVQRSLEFCVEARMEVARSLQLRRACESSKSTPVVGALNSTVASASKWCCCLVAQLRFGGGVGSYLPR